MTNKILLSFIFLFASIGIIAEKQRSQRAAYMAHDTTIVAIVFATHASQIERPGSEVSLDLLESRDFITPGTAAKIRADGYTVSFGPPSPKGLALRVAHASFTSTEYCEWTKSEKSFVFGDEATVTDCRDSAVYLRLKAQTSGEPSKASS